MKANLKDILDVIPDFDDLTKLVNEISELSFEKLRLENKIKQEEAETFRKAMSIPNADGKLPSASFVTNSYIHTGMNGEIKPLRDSLALKSSQLEKRKLLLSLYRDMMELYRTFSANERSSTSF